MDWKKWIYGTRRGETYDNWIREQLILHKDISIQQRLRSVWIFAQSAQSFHWPHKKKSWVLEYREWSVKTDQTVEAQVDNSVFPGCTRNFVGFSVFLCNYVQHLSAYNKPVHDKKPAKWSVQQRLRSAWASPSSLIRFVCLCWGLTSQSTIFQSCRDGATASWVINQYFRGVKCLAQGHNTAAVDFQSPTSRSGVQHSTNEPLRSPSLIRVVTVHVKKHW